MKLLRREFLQLSAGAAALPALPRIARAQAYPTRPITMVVGFGTGGPSDTSARILAERMRTFLGQAIIVENITGAAGSIGTGRVARAAPDGYTIGFGDFSTHAANSALYALSYDVMNDFAPISLTNNTPWLIVARNTLPVNDLRGLINWLKTNSGRALAGTSGVGSAGHVNSILLQNAIGTQLRLIPYRGDGQALQDVVSGQIDFMFGSPATSLPHVRSGNIKAFAVTDAHRLAIAPDIPTADEAGLPSFQFLYWQSLWAPKDTPKEIIVKLNTAVVETLADPSVRSRFAELGLEIFPQSQQTPEALAAWQRAEIEKWGPIIKAAGIKGE